MLAGHVNDLLAINADHIDMRLRIRVIVDRVIAGLPDHMDRAEVRQSVESRPRSFVS